MKRSCDWSSFSNVWLICHMQFVLKIVKLFSHSPRKQKCRTTFGRRYTQNWANKIRLTISNVLERNTTHSWHSLTKSIFHNFRNFGNFKPLLFWDNQHPTNISNYTKPISTQNHFTTTLKRKALSHNYWQETMPIYLRMLLFPSDSY